MTAILGIIAELLKLFNTLHAQYQDPKMVEAKIEQMRQDIADHNARVETVLQDPQASKEQKDAALAAIRLSDS